MEQNGGQAVNLQTLIGMQLHETMTFNDATIMRVCGGWIYRIWTLDQEEIVVFVPLPRDIHGITGIDL